MTLFRATADIEDEILVKRLTPGGWFRATTGTSGHGERGRGRRKGRSWAK